MHKGRHRRFIQRKVLIFLSPIFVLKMRVCVFITLRKVESKPLVPVSSVKWDFFFPLYSFVLIFFFCQKRKDIIFELIIFNFQRTKAKKLLQSQVLNERSTGKGPAQGRQCGPLHKDAWGSTGAVGGGQEREGTFIKENGQNICHLATLSYNIFFNPHNNTAVFIWLVLPRWQHTSVCLYRPKSKLFLWPQCLQNN